MLALFKTLFFGVSNSGYCMMSRWLSIECQYMEGNKANGISWRVGSLTIQFTVRMLFG